MLRTPNLFHYINYSKPGGKFKRKLTVLVVDCWFRQARTGCTRRPDIVVELHTEVVRVAQEHCRTAHGSNGQSSCVGTVSNCTRRQSELRRSTVELHKKVVRVAQEHCRTNCTLGLNANSQSPLRTSLESEESHKRDRKNAANHQNKPEQKEQSEGASVLPRFSRQIFPANQSDFSRSAQNQSAIIWGRSCTVAELSVASFPAPNQILPRSCGEKPILLHGCKIKIWEWPGNEASVTLQQTLCRGCGFKVSNCYLCCYGNTNFM